MACVPGGVLRRSRLQLQGWFGRARDLRYLPSDDQQGPSQSAISFPARTPKPLTRSGDIPEHWPNRAARTQQVDGEQLAGRARAERRSSAAGPRDCLAKREVGWFRLTA